jgi:hypothetical protein
MTATLELIVSANSAIVNTGGTTAPSAGTVETWSVMAEAWPVLAAGTAFRAMDAADLGKTSAYEIFLVTANANGTTASWTVTRGIEGTPYKHLPGFTLIPVATPTGLDNRYLTLAGGSMQGPISFPFSGGGTYPALTLTANGGITSSANASSAPLTGGTWNLQIPDDAEAGLVIRDTGTPQVFRNLLSLVDRLGLPLFGYGQNGVMWSTGELDFVGGPVFNPSVVVSPWAGYLSHGTEINLKGFSQLSPTASLVSGGSLASGTTAYYKVSALRFDGSESQASAEISATPSGSNLSVQIQWTRMTGACQYHVYKTTTSGSYSSTSLVYSVYDGYTNGPGFSWTDTGAATPTTGQPLAAPTAQAQVNLFRSSGTVANTTPAITLNNAGGTAVLGQWMWDGTLQLASGSVSEPGLSFISDATTGLYLPTAGTLGISAGGTEVASATSSGFNILVGNNTIGQQVAFNSVTANFTAQPTSTTTWLQADTTSGSAPSITLPNDGKTYRVELTASFWKCATASNVSMGIGTDATHILAACYNQGVQASGVPLGPVVIPQITGSGQTLKLFILNATSTGASFLVTVAAGAGGSSNSTPCALAAYRVA